MEGQIVVTTTLFKIIPMLCKSMSCRNFVKDLNGIPRTIFFVFLFFFMGCGKNRNTGADVSVEQGHIKAASQQKKFYVSPDGNDQNSGTSQDQALQTIRTAVGKMSPGDVCYLRQGVYRETVTINKSNITLTNFEDEVPVISGLDPVDQWTPHGSGIYKATFIPEEREETPGTPWHLKGKGRYFTQVFCNGELMTESQFPNRNSNLLDWEGSRGGVKIFPGGSFSFDDPGTKKFEGGIFHAIVERKFAAVQGLVGSNQGARYTCKEFTNGWKKSTPANFTKHLFTSEGGQLTGEGRGFVFHHLNALDQEREWFWDKPSNTLYFFPPAGVDPSKMKVEAKSRKLAVVITQAAQVQLKGIHVIGAGIELNQSTNVVVDGMNLSYPMSSYYYADQDEYNGKAMLEFNGGRNNTVRNSYIGHAWGSGILIREGQNHAVENCMVEDVDWMGTYNACIRASGTGTKITRNTLRRSGRFIVEGIGIQSGQITYNNMYDGMLIGQDGGGFYTHLTNGAQTEIAFNWVHDIIGIPFERSEAKDHNLSIGVYLDGGCSNYYVHHNVIWNVKYGVMLNVTPGAFPKPSSGNRVDYNTIVASDVAVLSKEEPKLYYNNSARHNLGNRKVAALIEKDSNEVDASGKLETQLPARVKHGEKSRIPRKSIRPEITSDIEPEAGAYERKVPKWKPGADTIKIPLLNKISY